MINPNVDLPTWKGHRHQHTHNLWDGAKRPATCCFAQYPTTIRAILPVLATKALDGRASDSERQQLRELRVWDVKTGQSILPSPRHCAQWLGVPEEYAIQMLGANDRCLQVIDDLQCESQDHWGQMTEDLQPPKDRMSQCRSRHWCKGCASLISILGNGWHVTAATVLVEAVIEKAARAKRGQPAEQLDYGKHIPHQCTWNCRCRMKLGDVKQMARTQRAKTPKASDDTGFIDT